MVIQLGVCPLFEAVAEDDDAASTGYLQVEFNMSMAEDIVIAVVVLFLLVLGEENEFFFVFTFVGTGVGDVLQTASFRPTVTEFVAPRGW